MACAMAAEIQKISITDALTVHKPAKHIAYTVQVSTPTRSWSVNRRYNDFLALDAELRSATGKEPPSQLPPKHWFKRTMNDEEIRQRRVGLEHYLRTILTTKDARWRQAFGWSDFLAVPTSSKSAADAQQPLNAASWTTEHAALGGVLRSARAALLKRDALARVGDSSARASGGEARRLLRDAGPRVDALERALGTPALSALGDGERRRREDLVAGLRAECANLLRMAEAGVRAQQTTPPPDASPGGVNGGNVPGAFQASFQPRGRVFGKKAPEETTETRALDDRGLVQLQATQMSQQDEQLGVLSGILRRQRVMGEEIHSEIEQQTEMLEQIDHDVDRVGSKLARTKRQLNRLNG